MAAPLVINLALTGMVPRLADNPHVPMTTDEVAADVQRCFQAGARVFHVRAREADETPSPRRELFAAIVCRIRQTTPRAIICVTTSGRLHNTLLSDPGLSRSLAANAQRLVHEDFSLDAMGQAYDAVLRGFIGAKRPAAILAGV